MKGIRNTFNKTSKNEVTSSIRIMLFVTAEIKSSKKQRKKRDINTNAFLIFTHGAFCLGCKI